MKVLFVSSGRTGKVGNVVKNQGKSLENTGIEVDYFLVNPGTTGYIKSIRELRNVVCTNKFDIVHAHYSLCGFVSALAGCRPLVVSLMGSDVFMSWFFRVVARYFYRTRWSATIVKTDQMKIFLNVSKAFVIPNGVDVELFKPISQQRARDQLGFHGNKEIILFISNPNRGEKNFELAENAVKKLNNQNVELIKVYDVPNTKIPLYLNAANVLLLTSKWEGSANVVKEAMSCNRPVVSTNVGDIQWLFGDVPGHFIAQLSIEDVTEKLDMALKYSRKHKTTCGSDRILKLGLDSNTISRRIVNLYYNVIKNNEDCKR